MKQKESLAQKSVYWLKVISLGLILGFGIQFAQAWTSPAAAPPGGNVSGPLTTSGIGQIKAGNLALNTDGIYANALLIPSGNVGIGTVSPLVELHVKATAGNADIGTESVDGFKWTMSTESGSGSWVLNRDIPGTLPTIVALRSGNVGIGTINPAEKLDVNGNVKATGVLTAGKVQIVDVVVENTDCAPMGLVARDNTGIILSCQGSPLKWKKASGGGGNDCPGQGLLNNQIQIITNGFCPSLSASSTIINQCINGAVVFVGCVAPAQGAAG